MLPITVQIQIEKEIPIKGYNFEVNYQNEVPIKRPIVIPNNKVKNF